MDSAGLISRKKQRASASLSVLPWMVQIDFAGSSISQACSSCLGHTTATCSAPFYQTQIPQTHLLQIVNASMSVCHRWLIWTLPAPASPWPAPTVLPHHRQAYPCHVLLFQIRIPFKFFSPRLTSLAPASSRPAPDVLPHHLCHVLLLLKPFLIRILSTQVQIGNHAGCSSAQKPPQSPPSQPQTCPCDSPAG